jgi:predicted transcriptional regulator of viral defense system
MEDERRARRRRLFALAAEQGGFFTAAQAREIGYSYQAQAHHVHVGNWERVGRGLFLLEESPAGPHDDLALWTLWSRGRGVVSYDSALAVYEIGEFESGRTHLTVPRGFSMRHRAVRLHFDELRPHEVEQHVGFRVTTPARSLIDVARSGPDEYQLARAIDDALERRRVTIKQLRSESEVVDARAALYIERAIGLSEAA